MYGRHYYLLNSIWFSLMFTYLPHNHQILVISQLTVAKGITVNFEFLVALFGLHW